MNRPASPAPRPASGTAERGTPAENAADNSRFSQSLRNILWMSSGSVVTRVLNVARGIILARLLTPFDFGVYGLAGSVVGIKERVADIGAGVFLVYRPKELEEHAETTFWVNLGLSTVLLTLLVIAAPVLGRFYREPLVSPVLILLGLGVWARVNASIHQNLLRTQSRFRTLAIIDNVSSASWLVVAVVLAWKGFGVWALAVSALAANAITATLLFTTQGWKPHWRMSKTSLRLLGGFSFWFLGQGIAWYLVTNMDNLLIGRYLGMSLLGIYALAYNYALLPVSTVANAIGNVGFAELPKLYDRPEAFWAGYTDFSRVQALVACLIAFAAAVSAPDLIPLVFGGKWDAAIVPFQILSVYAAVRCLWLDPFLAKGNFRASSLTGFASVVVAAVLVGLGLRYGVAGVACAMLLVQLGFNVVSLRVTSGSWRRLRAVARVTLPYLAGGVAAALAAMEVRQLALAGRIEFRFVVALLTVGVFSGIYAILFRNDLRAVYRKMRERQPTVVNP
jgi:O-antigen/teichoic acid export membrane protein